MKMPEYLNLKATEILLLKLEKVDEALGSQLKNFNESVEPYHGRSRVFNNVDEARKAFENHEISKSTYIMIKKNLEYNQCYKRHEKDYMREIQKAKNLCESICHDVDEVNGNYLAEFARVMIEQNHLELYITDSETYISNAFGSFYLSLEKYSKQTVRDIYALFESLSLVNDKRR